ncbi:ATP-binding response regulator [Nonomuraea aurantiaca]|uniref:ATP-binding response regulator n=1 Tax=Nonomuraea aurantiaca TaxID=2878562 RepID=UPI001CDA44EA|nr:ATP-binding protein [Nonomuraea aurantiaca]MCA2220375.1 response regulator [Nonomuraea aurantiaca]
MTATELARAALEHDHDVFVVRRLGKAVAELAGLEAQDQVRVATALSEVCRELLGTGAVVVFSLDEGKLLITMDHAMGADFARSEGLALAGRLVDVVTLDAEHGRVTIAKRLPPHSPRLPIDQIRERLSRMAPVSALEELRQQNKELASTLEDVLRLNAELQETNTGVLALYNQLSAELEETNRGVVALYGELDEKSSQLREAAEARNRFWATVSHELRTPLNSIIGLVRLMVGPGSEPLSEEQTRQVRFIGGSAESLLEQVGELLDMAKAESGRLDPQSSVVHLPTLADHLRLAMQPTSGPGDVTLRVDVAPDVTDVYTDEGMLVRVLRNLLSNALKFTQEGEVRLSARADAAAGEVVITVTDTGIGIPREYLATVFEEFFQVPSALQVRVKGTGLGLPYARRLTEALGGTLELASDVGRGTTVTIRLPHHDGTPEIARVLVADDDEAFRAAARRMLYGFAVEVEEAADGVAALEMMTARPPDVILLDMLMPRLDGTALLQRMAEDQALGRIGVVVVTIRPDAAPSGHPVLSKQGLRRDQLLQALRGAAGTDHD